MHSRLALHWIFGISSVRCYCLFSVDCFIYPFCLYFISLQLIPLLSFLSSWRRLHRHGRTIPTMCMRI
jgi:hypothetical protein